MINQMPRKSHPRASGYRSQLSKLNLRDEIKHRHHKDGSKKHDDEDSCDEVEGHSEHDKFLVWDPKGFKEKFESMI